MKVFFCVLDFEATCERDRPMRDREIIEFPSILYCLDEGKIGLVGRFQKYVRPTIHPQLSAFCTELTGITQTQVDESETIQKVYKQHFAWLEPQIRGSPCWFVTCGNWDLETQLPAECATKKMKMHNVYTKWINIKDIFQKFYQYKPTSLQSMLDFLTFEFEGRPHSGIDDCVNTGRILCKLVQDGWEMK